ncbi:MAG: AMP nucleosidase [Devosiaceae bacterium]|nr:AMP nucleosidase [Devosiaceae bacterium MH13]
MQQTPSFQPSHSAHSTVTTRSAEEAVDALLRLYEDETARLRQAFYAHMKTNPAGDSATHDAKVRGFYPFVRLATQTYADVDSRLAYGHVTRPGQHETTITQPALYRSYLLEQISALITSHDVPVEVGLSDTPIPIHFAFPDGMVLEGDGTVEDDRPLRDYFDVPDLGITDDAIVNGVSPSLSQEPFPLSLFTAPRIDYSLYRLKHYTATPPEAFQNFVLYTNYQFYIDEFIEFSKAELEREGSDYTHFVEPGGRTTYHKRSGKPVDGSHAARVPQMPTYHLCAPDHRGVTIVNIGVGPSNAKTITDHVAVLRSHAWLMLGHCAGLRNSQRLGDYVLAHGYVREDHVLDADLPPWVPIPPLAEVQVALEQAVAEVTDLSGYDLKRIMRTGTVATIDNRNWELRDFSEPVERFSQSRAIALDMESATIAANGFRFRVPYGTLLCVSDKPLHGELKLPGMASAFYKRQVSQHLKIGIRAMELLRSMPNERLHSRKLRSFSESAFQ